MTPEARGVYRELLDACWAEPGCALPADDATLAGLAGVSMDYWIAVRAQVLAWFDEADGKLTNPRALYEWKKARGFRSEKRKSGRAGAKAKWDKKKAEGKEGWHSHASAIDSPLAKSSSPSPSSVIRQPSSVGTEEQPPYVPPDVRTENALRGARAKNERRLLELVGLISERTNADPSEVIKQVTAYKRKADDQLVTGRTNPALLSDERLEKSIEDGEAWLVTLPAVSA
jgi:uncharacterized protein YdaU (DUF1376 family)